MGNKYKIEYLPVAKQDMNDIIDYVAKDNPDGAIQLLNKIDEEISQLASLPFIGKVPYDDRLRRMGYRVLLIGIYLVFYVIKEPIIEIRRIIHGKRRYEFLI